MWGPGPDPVPPEPGIKIGDRVLVTGGSGGPGAACTTGDIITVENIYVSAERNMEGEEYITVPGEGEPAHPPPSEEPAASALHARR